MRGRCFPNFYMNFSDLGCHMGGGHAPAAHLIGDLIDDLIGHPELALFEARYACSGWLGVSG